MFPQIALMSEFYIIIEPHIQTSRPITIKEIVLCASFYICVYYIDEYLVFLFVFLLFFFFSLLYKFYKYSSEKHMHTLRLCRNSKYDVIIFHFGL